MTGLRYKDRVSGTEHQLDLAGVFVQIGLVPNTGVPQGHGGAEPFWRIVVDAKVPHQCLRHLRRR